VHVHTRLYTNGDWLDPLGDATIDVVSPYTEQIVGRVPDGTPADIERAVAAARAAFDTGPWPRLPVADRAAVLDRAADLLERRAAEVGALIIAEMGSPASFVATGQVPVPIAFLRAAAALGREFPFEERLDGGDGGSTLVLQEPVGVVGCIVPSNFPLLLAAAQIAPAIVAGCCVVLKPAPESPLDTYVLAEVLQEAGLPPGVVNIVPGGSVAGTRLVRHPDVDKVAYTGSAAVGRQVASWCGERLARVSLELGGKSAAIVLDDAPLEQTVAGLLPMAFLNSGQACVAQTRILVSRSRRDEFVEAFAEATAAMTIGDPADLGTQIGPLLARRQRDRVESYLDLGRDAGAKVVVGGGRPASQPRGWFVEPTLFVDVDNSMRIAREEIFGPVVCVLDYDDPAEAVAIANDSEYGLSGSVWTADVAAGIDIARRVRTGMVSVNGAFQSPDAPFGGYKNSGIGRECGTAGLSLYLESKSVGLPPSS